MRLQFDKECKSFSPRQAAQNLEFASTIPSEELLKALDENSGNNAQW